MPAAHPASDADRQPDGIHIRDADGRVLRADLPTRKAGRTLARKLTRDGRPVYLVDPNFHTRVTPYARGAQAGGSTIGIVPDAPATTEPAPRSVDDPVRTLPDLLRPGLDLVFVGINPGERSAQLGHYYGHRGNAFWRALSESSLVASEVGSGDDRSLLDCGIGFTDVVKRVQTDSTQVTDAELRAATPAFERRIAFASPRAVCFTTTRAFDVLFPRVRASRTWGRQPVHIADAEVWVMPSTSGRAAGYRDEGRRVLAEIACALGRGKSR